MITFIHPYAFIWLALAIPLVLFYMWKAHRPQAEVVTGALWRKAIPLLHPRRAWQRQRWITSLAIQLAILLVLATALAEPCWRRPQRVVLILDATASMSVTDSSGKTRYSQAQEKARELIQNMGYVDSLAVLVVGETIQIHSRMSHDRAQILSVLEEDNLPKTGGKAPIHEAVSMAKALIKAGTGGVWDAKTNHVILVSDGSFPLSEQVLEDETVRWIPAGETVGNIQLETLSVERRDALKPASAEIFIALRNYGAKTVSGILRIAYGAENVELPVEIPALAEGGLLTRTATIQEPGAVKIRAEFALQEGEEARVDALAEDNTAETQLQEAFSYRVTVVTPQEPNTLLENAVLALPGVLLERVTTSKGARLSATEMKKLPTEPFSVDKNGVKRYEIVIFDRTLPESGAKIYGNNKNPADCMMARTLFFAPPEATALWKRSASARDYVIMPWLDGLRSGISTAGIGFTGTYALSPEKGATVAPWLFSQSALEVNENKNVAEEDKNFAKQAKTVEMTELAWGLEGENSENGSATRSVLVSCDLTQSDWILADDFPRFLQYSFDWLIHTKASDARILRGVETYWEPEDGFTDSDLNVPIPLEKVFVFPGEDIIPIWTILVLLIAGAWMAEWYFYQRRWLE